MKCERPKRFLKPDKPEAGRQRKEEGKQEDNKGMRNKRKQDMVHFFMGEEEDDKCNF